MIEHSLKSDMQNVNFFTLSKFKAKNLYPEKCVIFDNTIFAKKPKKILKIN